MCLLSLYWSYILRDFYFRWNTVKQKFQSTSIMQQIEYIVVYHYISFPYDVVSTSVLSALEEMNSYFTKQKYRKQWRITYIMNNRACVKFRNEWKMYYLTQSSKPLRSIRLFFKKYVYVSMYLFNYFASTYILIKIYFILHICYGHHLYSEATYF